MELARVTGTVVATRRSPGLDGVRLLVVVPEDEQGRPTGDALVAADALQAGIGERVWIVHGREASLSLPVTFVPVDHAVVAIVDDVARR